MLIAAATRGAKSNAASILDQLDKQVDADFQLVIRSSRDLSSLKMADE